MYNRLKTLCVFAASGLISSGLFAQTDGEGKLEATILDYTGTSNTRHWAVVWVTAQSGTFIKTVWI